MRRNGRLERMPGPAPQRPLVTRAEVGPLVALVLAVLAFRIGTSLLSARAIGLPLTQLAVFHDVPPKFWRLDVDTPDGFDFSERRRAKFSGARVRAGR